jgi:dTDP-4-dehydrorhamnose reductase
MKLLVTGANGQVGSEFSNSLLAKQLNIDVIACDRTELDITDINSVEQCIAKHKPDAIVNAAAYTAVDKAESDIDNAYAINEKGPLNLASVCNKHKIPLVHISTDYVFDGNKQGAYSEFDDPNPTGIYGKSKLAGELAISNTHAQHYIIRVAWVFGEYGNNFVKTMLKLADKDALNIVADQFGSPTWAKDIADVCLLLANNVTDKSNTTNVEFGTYHYSGDVRTNWSDFAHAIFDSALQNQNIASKPQVSAIPTSEYPTPAKRPQNSTLNCEKIHKALNIDSSNWQLGLQHVLKEWK